MRIAIHQPNYLPWANFFHKMAHCDVFILLDNVQYPRREYCNRTRVKSPQGAFWLTLPVEKANINNRISEVRLYEPEKNLARHLQSLQHFYARAPYYRSLEEKLEPIYKKSWEYLASLNIALIKILAGLLEITTPILLASNLGEPPGGRNQRIIYLCQKLGADVYLSGKGGESYNDQQALADAGITLEYQSTIAPVYPQGSGAFIASLSLVDLLAYAGQKSSCYLW